MQSLVNFQRQDFEESRVVITMLNSEVIQSNGRWGSHFSGGLWSGFPAALSKSGCSDGF